MAPVSAPPSTEEPTLRQRLWPETLAARITLLAMAAGVIAYAVGVLLVRYAGMWSPIAADGDQFQAVFQYWRYTTPGAFPPGDLFNDYAFAVHAPPFWWALMALGSSIATPLLTAKVLNIIAFILACVMMWLAAARRSNAFVGLVAVVLMLRGWDFTYIIAGGYARSFGPFLTLLFLDSLLAQRHRRTLVILVIQAGLYPSVVLPCGFAYGLYVVVRGPMRDRIRRSAGMFVAGLLIIALGKSQDLQAEKWWGHIVNLQEAQAMPAWGPGGRNAELPLMPVSDTVARHLVRAFRPTGGHHLESAASYVTSHVSLLGGALVVGMVAASLLTLLRRRRGGWHADPFPWQVPFLFSAAFVAFIAARIFFFKLYMPYRPLQHVWPYMVYVGIPLMTWSIATAFIRNRGVAVALTALLVLVPTFAVLGDGFAAVYPTYRSYRTDKPLYDWMATQPQTAIFAGELTFTDRAPLFSQRMTYARKNLTHPFREPLYNECERRLREMYTAIYASTFSEIIEFARRERVDFFIVRDATFVQTDPTLFQPLTGQLAPIFRKNKPKGFALEQAPSSSIVYRNERSRVISVAKLAEALAAGEMADAATPPPPQPRIPRQLPNPKGERRPVLAPAVRPEIDDSRSFETDQTP